VTKKLLEITIVKEREDNFKILTAIKQKYFKICKLKRKVFIWNIV